MKFIKEELVKSPLNYTGGKYKLLPQILPYFPENIDIFYDLFCGGCNVGINVKANKIICNDIETHIINLLQYFSKCKSNNLIENIENIINYYGLSNTFINGYEYYGCNSSSGVAKYNKDKYLKLREDYNKDTSNNLLFYIVLMFAFNNQIRFNSNGKFNMPVNKRDFNKNIRNNTINFINKLNNTSIYFTNKDFREVNIEYSNNNFIYADPPYLISCASYNESDGWNERNEKDLLQLLDKYNEKGIKFALSNVLENKGKSNDILKEWSKKYKIIHLNNTYGNCNYHSNNKNKDTTDEVLIINY